MTPPRLTHALLAGTSHGFFGRQGGVSTGIYDSLNVGRGSADTAHHVTENRARVTRALGAKALFTGHQTHSANVAVIETVAAPDTPAPKADALVTRQAGIAIGALSADCTPVLFHAPQSGVIAAAHAGWRGAHDGVLAATVARMQELGANLADIRAVIGPTISRYAYEVGPEFVARFAAHPTDCAQFFLPADRPEHAHFDLPGFAHAQLRAAGLAPAHIADTAQCTYWRPEIYFSNRRNVHAALPDYGRQISAICRSL